MRIEPPPYVAPLALESSHKPTEKQIRELAITLELVRATNEAIQALKKTKHLFKSQ